MLDYRWSHNPPTCWRTVTPNWYWTHTVSKFGLQSSWTTGACHYTQWCIPLNQLSVPSRDTQKQPIAYISKWNCNPPQWCASRVYGWQRVVKLLNPSQILRTVSDLLKILSKNFHPRFHLTFFTEKKEKKKLLNCFEGKGEKFPKYHYVSQSRSTHVVVIVIPVRFIDVLIVWMDIKEINRVEKHIPRN